MTAACWARAEWDEEAGCWYVEESNIPGLAAGAPSLPELLKNLEVLVPELLTANGNTVSAIVPLDLIAHLRGQVSGGHKAARKNECVDAEADR